MVKALELIGYGHHLNKYGDLCDDWDPANYTEA